jgi:DNA-directed RNA polymerase sigma subunit (sigma70/sigma32)
MGWPFIPIAQADPDPAGCHDRPDSLMLYMREAGEVPLINRQQEIELAARSQRGDEAAREQMIRANLRFMIKIARESENLGLPLLDLINEGNIGLMKAVERFDPAKAKLSTGAGLPWSSSSRLSWWRSRVPPTRGTPPCGDSRLKPG